MDKAKSMFGSPDKVKDLAAQHGDQIVKGVDKATDVVDDKTKGKFSDQLDKVDDGAEKVVDKLDDK
jgi:hypothetical protein